MAERAASKCADLVEKMALGVEEIPRVYETDPQVYGVMNHPGSLKMECANPLGLQPKEQEDIMVKFVEDAKRKLFDAHHRGPFHIYHSRDLDDVINAELDCTSWMLPAANNKGKYRITDRLRAIEQVKEIRSSAFLPKGTICLVEMTAATCRAVVDYPPIIVQWKDEKKKYEGFVRGTFEDEITFKVLTSCYPEIRTDSHGRCGVVVGKIRPHYARTPFELV
jgi:hypothetical protein